MYQALSPYQLPWLVFVAFSLLFAMSTFVVRPRTNLGRIAAGIVTVSAMLLGFFQALLYLDHPIAGLILWSDFLIPGSLLAVGAMVLSVIAHAKQTERRAVTTLLLAADSSIAAITIVPLVFALIGT